MLYTVTCVFEPRTEEVEADSPHYAVSVALSHLGPGWKVVSVDGDESLTPIGHCEGCGFTIFEGEAYTVDQDLVYVCSDCQGD